MQSRGNVRDFGRSGEEEEVESRKERRKIEKKE